MGGRDRGGLDDSGAPTVSADANEALFRASFDGANVGMAVVDTDGIWLRVNQALADLLGYSRSELEGRSFQAFTHPDDLVHQAWFDDAVAGRAAHTAPLEKRYIDAAGRTVWAAVHSSVVRDPDGLALFVISHIRDITEQRRHADAERRRRQRADCLVRLSDALAALFTADLDELLESVASELVSVVGEFAVVFLASEDDPDRLELRGLHHRSAEGAAFLRDVISNEPMRAGEGIVGSVFGTGRPFIVADIDLERVRAHVRADLEPKIDHLGGAVSIVVLPLRMGDRVLGVMALGQGPHARAVEEEDIAFLTMVADRVALAIENTRLYGALRASEERMRLINRGAPVGLLIIGAEGRIIEATPALCALVGRSEDELVGLHGFELSHPDESADNEQRFAALIHSGGDVLQYENRFLRPDGTTSRALVHATVVRGADGSVDHLLVQTVDITERRHAQEILAAVFASVPDLLAIIGSDGNPTALNPAWTSILGWPTDELIGRPILDLVHPDDLEATLAEFADGGGATQFENRFRTQSGDYRWLQWNSVLLPDEGRWVASARDVTAQRRQGEELRQSNADLTQFASVAAHDLKSPLAVIAGFADLLTGNRAVAMDDEASESVQLIGDSAHRLLQLVDDLLGYSRVGAGPVPRHPVDLAIIADEVKAGLAKELDLRGASVDIGPLPVVEGDATQLRQLLQNLMSNAAKFVPAGTRPEVRVSAASVDGCWQVAVADNGIGVAPADRDRIFGMFCRLPDAAAFEGTGIGLAICRRIVERHGGSIWLDDNDPTGTIVRLSLGDLAADQDVAR